MASNIKQKVARVGVIKEAGWLYYVDKDGDVSRVQQNRGRGERAADVTL